MEYFWLSTDHEDEEYVFLTRSIKDSNQNRVYTTAFLEGLEPPRDLPAELFMIAEEDTESRKLPAVIGNDANLLVVHTSLKELIRAAKTADEIIDMVPVTIIDQKKNVLSRDYFFVSPRGSYQYLDENLSDVLWYEDDHSRGSLETVVLDEQKMSRQPAMFRLSPAVEEIFINKEILENYKTIRIEDRGIFGKTCYGNCHPQISIIQKSKTLMEAIKNDDAQMATQLLDEGLDPKAKIGRYPRLPLLLAINEGANKCATLFIERGSPVNINDGDDTPLGYAVRRNNFGIVSLLLEHGADPDVPSGSDKEIALFQDIDCELAELLLEHGANLEIRSWARFTGPCATPLLNAIAEEEDELIELFLKKGADIHARGEWDWCSALGIVKNQIKQELNYLQNAVTKNHAQALYESIENWQKRAERLIAAGAGSLESEAQDLAWLRALNLEEIEKTRQAFLALGTKAAAEKPDFGKKVLDILGDADKVSNSALVSAVVSAILAKKAVKSSPDYAAIFCSVCERQRPVEDHAKALFDLDDNEWSVEDDESGTVEAFADGEYDDLTELCKCLDDANFAPTEAWLSCFNVLCETAERIERYPDELGKLAKRAFVKSRPDGKALLAQVKKLID